MIFLNFDPEPLAPALAEFRAAKGIDAELAVIGITRARARPEERQVFRLTAPGHDYAMKRDTRGGETGRLRDEFARLEQFAAHFEGDAAHDVVAPVYLGQGGDFHITRFVEAPTAIDRIEAARSLHDAAAVFRRAGAWLDRFHRIEPADEAPFWPRWHFERIDTLRAAADPPQADKATVRRYVEALRAGAKVLRGRPTARRLCHGDLHGNNLLIGKEGVTGLDLAEARRKLTIYDLVDIFRLDWRHDFTSAGHTDAGLTRIAEDAFFDAYTLPVDREIFAFAMKARLLMDWLSITSTRHAASGAQRRRFGIIATRLAAAFDA